MAQICSSHILTPEAFSNKNSFKSFRNIADRIGDKRKPWRNPLVQENSFVKPLLDLTQDFTLLYID